MRTWTRALIGDVCGGCGAVLDPDAPILTIAAEGWTKIRCAACAGEAVPADLPAIVEHTITPTPLQRFAQLANLLPIDWKARGAGERDVGEEG